MMLSAMLGLYASNPALYSRMHAAWFVVFSLWVWRCWCRDRRYRAAARARRASR